MVVHSGAPVSPRDARWLALPAALLAALLGAVAVVSPATAVLGAAAVLFVSVAFHNLAAGVALFTVVTFFETVPAVGDTGAVKVAGLVLVLAALRRSGTPLLLKEHPAVAYAAALLAVWAAASVLWAEDVARATSESIRLALGVALVFVVFAAVRQARHARWVLWGYLAGAAGAALVGVADPAEDQAGRLAGGFGEPNFLAAMLVPALVFSVFGLSWSRRAAERWLFGVCAVLFMVALFLTQSRGGLVALAAAFGAALVVGGRARRHFAVIAALAAAVGVVYYASYASPQAIERLTNPGGGTGRSDLWSVATEVVSDHPVVGVGIGNFPVVAPEYATTTVNLPSVHLIVDTPKVAHNTYLGVFAELGAVGLVALVVLLLTTLVLLRRATRTFVRVGEAELELLSRALFVGLVGMLTAFVFLSGEYEKQFWVLVGLAVAVYGIARRRQAAQPRS